MPTSEGDLETAKGLVGRCFMVPMSYWKEEGPDVKAQVRRTIKNITADQYTGVGCVIVLSRSAVQRKEWWVPLPDVLKYASNAVPESELAAERERERRRLVSALSKVKARGGAQAAAQAQKLQAQLQQLGPAACGSSVSASAAARSGGGGGSSGGKRVVVEGGGARGKAAASLSPAKAAAPPTLPLLLRQRLQQVRAALRRWGNPPTAVPLAEQKATPKRGGSGGGSSSPSSSSPRAAPHACASPPPCPPMDHLCRAGFDLFWSGCPGAATQVPQLWAAFCDGGLGDGGLGGSAEGRADDGASTSGSSSSNCAMVPALGAEDVVVPSCVWDLVLGALKDEEKAATADDAGWLSAGHPHIGRAVRRQRGGREGEGDGTMAPAQAGRVVGVLPRSEHGGVGAAPVLWRVAWGAPSAPPPQQSPPQQPQQPPPPPLQQQQHEELTAGAALEALGEAAAHGEWGEVLAASLPLWPEMRGGNAYTMSADVALSLARRSSKRDPDEAVGLAAGERSRKRGRNAAAGGGGLAATSLAAGGNGPGGAPPLAASGGALRCAVFRRLEPVVPLSGGPSTEMQKPQPPKVRRQKQRQQAPPQEGERQEESDEAAANGPPPALDPQHRLFNKYVVALASDAVGMAGKMYVGLVERASGAGSGETVDLFYPASGTREQSVAAQRIVMVGDVFAAPVDELEVEMVRRPTDTSWGISLQFVSMADRDHAAAERAVHRQSRAGFVYVTELQQNSPASRGSTASNPGAQQFDMLLNVAGSEVGTMTVDEVLATFRDVPRDADGIARVLVRLARLRPS